jgi:hypothetical protein
MDTAVLKNTEATNAVDGGPWKGFTKETWR